jgi:hypothetical protein
MRRFVLIEIDHGREHAPRNSLLYDSAAKGIWQFLNGNWRRVEPDFRI